MKPFIHKLTRTLTPDRKSFIYLFLLSLLSNCCILLIKCDVYSVFCSVTLSALMSWVIALIATRLNSHGGWGAKCSTVLVWIAAIVLNLLIITDYFLYFQFKMLMGQQVIDLVLRTNYAEAHEFVGSYFNPWLIVGGLLLLTAVNLLFRYIARHLKPTMWLKWVSATLALCGAGVLTYMVVMFVLFRNGAEIPTMTSATRLGYGYMQHLNGNRLLDRLIAVNTNVEASQLSDRATDYDIILIIGESFNRLHSPLYGYDKQTMPKLSALRDTAGMAVFTDVVTSEDWTQKVMRSIFAPGRYVKSFGNQALFPTILRQAGWHTELHDNEFIINSFAFFLNDRRMSELMFDRRNDVQYEFDGELTATVAPTDSLHGLYIVHLIGQHFNYDRRYPSEFARFTAADYDANKYNERQRTVLAHYDNATLYNDSVVADVIKKWEGRPAIVLYFPDHGEEIYDCRDYYGHGNAISATDISYQLHIPYFIYANAQFRDRYPDIVSAINEATDLPISTDDTYHLILDLAGVESADFDPTRSFINPKYDATTPRMVLHSVNYDAR